MSHTNPWNAWPLRLSLALLATAIVVPVLFFAGSPAAAQQAVPDQPEGLTGRLLHYLVVGLDWDDAEGATSYRAQYWDTTGDSPAWAEAPEAEYDGSSAVVSGLPDQRFYYFQVRAVNGAGASEWSDFFLTDNAWPEAPELTPEPTSTTAPELTPEPTSTTAPELTPEPTSTTAPELTPEPTSTTAPELTPEPTSTTAPEPTSTTAPEPTPAGVEEPEPTLEPTPEPGICDRTYQVREAIRHKIRHNDRRPRCEEVTAADLAQISHFSLYALYRKGIGDLKTGDFAGLSGLTNLNLGQNQIGSLPQGVFDELGSLKRLSLNNIQIGSLPPGIFDELGSLEELYLYNNQISSLSPGVFDELGSLKRLHLRNNRMSSLPPGIFDELGGLKYLHLGDNRISSLSPGAFDGLDSLDVLHLGDNQISSLSPGIFDELGSLDYLYLGDNQISSLPPGAFDGLGSLDYLYLSDNRISSLSPGAFDGLDSLEDLYLRYNQISSLSPGVFDGLGNLFALYLTGNKLSSLPPRLLPRVEWVSDWGGFLLFLGGNRLTELPDALLEVENLDMTTLHLIGNPGSPFTFSMEAEPISQSVDDEGIHTARVRYKVAQGAPVIMKGALEVSGGAASTTSVTIDAGRVYSDEIVVKQSEADQPVTLTLQNVGGYLTASGNPGIPWRDFQGTSFTAGAALTLFDSSKPTPTPTATPAPSGGICGRTPQVRDAILVMLPGVSDCAAVTDSDLSGITGRLGLNEKEIAEEITALKSGDFQGLTNLQSLDLIDNSLETLPGDIFEGLAGLTSLLLTNNALETLPEDVFEPLGSLTTLNLENNALSALPEDVFDGLTSLVGLFLTLNELSALPEEVFGSLTGMEVLYLGGNDLTTLPEEVFDGLDSLRIIRLNRNSLSALPSGVFEGAPNLRELAVAINGLETLPAGLFAGLTGLESLHLGDNEGTPFTFTAELERRGDDAVAVKVAEGAPFAMEVKLSADRGTLSKDTVTIEAGGVSSEEISVAAAGEGRREVTVSVESAEFVGVVVVVDKIGDYSGIQTGLGEELALDFFTPDSKNDPTITSPAPTVAIALSPSGSVQLGTEIGVTMRFSGLESDSDTGTTDYVFRADVVDSENGDADACEERAGGYGLGVDRYMYKVDEDHETRTGTVSAGCPAGDYTLRASVSSADNVELASAGATFSVREPETPLSSDATLSGLTLSGVDFGAFDPATTGYTAGVGNEVEQTTVTPTTNDDGATYLVKLGDVADEDGIVSLAEGSNVITVEVTAEDGNTAKTYKMTVTRAAPAAPPDAPDKPTGEVLEPGKVTLDWEDVDRATGYQVGLWSQPNLVPLPSEDMPGVTVQMNGSSAALNGLPAEWSHYWLKIRASNDGGTSGWSDWLTLENG